MYFDFNVAAHNDDDERRGVDCEVCTIYRLAHLTRSR